MSVRNNLLKALDASVGALLCQMMRLSPRAVNNCDTFPAVEHSAVKRILLIRPGGMGDMVLLRPIINLLQKSFANAEIDIVCERRNIQILKIEGFDGDAMTYDTDPFRFMVRLFRREYDIAIDTEQFHHFSAVFAFLSGAPIRVGFKINPRRNPLYTHLVNYSLEGYEGEQFMNLVMPLVKGEPAYILEGCIKSDELILSDTELKQKVEALGAYMIIHPGASTRYKLWAVDKYIKVSESLIDKYGAGIIFVGDNADAELASKIISGIQETKQVKCLSIAGKTDLISAAALISKADLFLGSDSGLSHLAAALDVKTVTVFGPSDCRKWGRKTAKRAVVKKDLPCSPCFIFGYNKPCESIACMSRITPEDVLQAVQSVMGQS